MRAREVLALNVKSKRKAAGYKSSRALAEDIGVSPVTLARIETCAVWPGTETISLIARALKCEESALFLDPDLTKPTYQQALDVLAEYGASLLEAAQSSSEVEAEKHAPQCNAGKLPSRRS